jgi:hypothetical protein
MIEAQSLCIMLRPSLKKIFTNPRFESWNQYRTQRIIFCSSPLGDTNERIVPDRKTVLDVAPVEYDLVLAEFTDPKDFESGCLIRVR